MTDGLTAIDPVSLESLVPINGLQSEQLSELARSAQILRLKAGQSLSDAEERMGAMLYVLDGELELCSGEHPVERIRGHSEEARFPLFPAGTPPLYWRAGSEPAKLLRLDGSLVSSLLIWMQAAQGLDEAGARRALTGRQVAAWVVRLLRSHLFRKIPPANVGRVFELMQTVELRAGDRVVSQGEAGDYYYVIRRGRCVVNRRGEGDSIQLAELQAGDTFGEEALVSGATRNADVDMLTDGTLMRLTKESFVELIREPVLDAVRWAEAERLSDQGAVWLDVRLPDEHSHYAIDGSTNIPLLELRNRLRELDPGTTYIVYSNTGNRSAAGCFLLAQFGFSARTLARGLLGGKQAPAAKQERSPPRRDRATQRLQAQLAKANAELEAALQDKAEATAARRYWAREAEAAEGASAEPQRKNEARAHLKLLEMRSATASRALSEAQRRKLELEAKLRATEARAARERAVAENACERVRDQAEKRLKQEQEKLSKEFARAAEALDALKRSRVDAESRRDQDHQRADAQFKQAQERLNEQARRVHEELEAAKRTAQSQSEQIRSQGREQEERLRAETEERLREERQRLEAEFAASLTKVEEARREVERIEAERKAVRERAERAEAQAEAEAKRASEERARREAQEQARQLARRPAASAKPVAPEAAGAGAQADKEPASDKAAERAFAEQELRLQLAAEAEEWVRQERKRSETDLQRLRDEVANMDRATTAAQEEFAAEDRESGQILSDIQAQLSSSNQALDRARGELALVQQRTVLTQWAEEEARRKRDAAKDAVRRARDHIERLREQAQVKQEGDKDKS